MENKKIVIIDCGSQYTYLLVNKFKNLSLNVELINFDDLNLFNICANCQGIIISGGPDSVFNNKSPKINKEIYKLNKPILGICYGMQLLHYDFGGEVVSSESSEYGLCILKKNKEHILLSGVSELSNIWCSHGDSVIKLAEGFETIASTEKIQNIVAVNDTAKIYTIQFHPEVTHTEFGEIILKNFIKKILNIAIHDKKINILEQKRSLIQKTIGKENVLLALSGGIDSSTLAYLLEYSIRNEQIYPIFIDNGLNLDYKTNEINKLFKEKFINFKIIDSKNLFLNKLRGVSMPEEKRKIIGSTFMEIFNNFVKNNKNLNIKFFAQGTICSDVIESGKLGKVSKVIKSHHNIVGWQFDNYFKIFEPFSNLFKNEVQELGKNLNLPKIITEQSPFPGPGLAIRIMGAITEEKLNLLKKAHQIFEKELIDNNLTNLYNQFLVILLKERGVGVKGDNRSYENIICLRAIQTINFMTAEVSNIPTKILLKISNSIINQIPEINRVVYDITSKPPATIEWE